MNPSPSHGIRFLGLGTAVPSKVITNDDLAQLVDTTDEWINSRTGFKERRVVSGDELVTDLAILAAKNALAYAGIDAKDIDLIVLANSTPDYIYPAGCAVVQNAIGATNAFGFDLSMACSGLMHAIGAASQYIRTGMVKTALVITADAHSRYTDWTDRNTCILFGDAAGAMILTRANVGEPDELLGLDFFLDGSRGMQLKLASNRPNSPLASPRTQLEPTNGVWMNGREVFRFAVDEVPRLILRALDKQGMTVDDIDHFVLHQANIRILDSMVDRLKLKPEDIGTRIIVELDRYSNTSSSTIPLALNDALEDSRIKPGKTLLMCGFGAGLAVGTVILKWNCVPKNTAPLNNELPLKREEPVTA